MGSIKIMDHTGHTTLQYEQTDKEAVQRAAQKFDELTKQGHTAFIKLEDGTSVKVNTFDAQQDYVMIPPVTGG